MRTSMTLSHPTHRADIGSRWHGESGRSVSAEGWPCPDSSSLLWQLEPRFPLSEEQLGRATKQRLTLPRRSRHRLQPPSRERLRVRLRRNLVHRTPTPLLWHPAVIAARLLMPGTVSGPMVN